MFGSMIRDFEEDPFFTSHREQMRGMEQMMGGFMSPFADMGFPRLMGPDMGMLPRGHPREQQQRQTAGRDAMMPFGFGPPNLFTGMNGMFANFDNMANDPNVHSYSSSSVFSYSTDERGTPQVYQASSSTRSAPGGVKETRRTVADTQKNYKKMAIGHHLGERAHIVERSQENGQQEENQEFLNLEEEEADSFNREWMHRARRQQPRSVHAIESENPVRRQYIHDEPKALPAPPSRKRDNEESRNSEKRGKKWPEKLKNKAKQPKNDE